MNGGEMGFVIERQKDNEREEAMQCNAQLPAFIHIVLSPAIPIKSKFHTNFKMNSNALLELYW